MISDTITIDHWIVYKAKAHANKAQVTKLLIEVIGLRITKTSSVDHLLSLSREDVYYHLPTYIYVDDYKHIYWSLKIALIITKSNTNNQ